MVFFYKYTKKLKGSRFFWVEWSCRAAKTQLHPCNTILWSNSTNFASKNIQSVLFGIALALDKLELGAGAIPNGALIPLNVSVFGYYNHSPLFGWLSFYYSVLHKGVGVRGKEEVAGVRGEVLEH